MTPNPQTTFLSIATLLSTVAFSQDSSTLNISTSSDNLQIHLTGKPNTEYTLEKSTNLTDWAIAETTKTPDSGKLTSIVPTPTSSTFYRSSSNEDTVSISQGRATTLIDTLLDCSGSRLSPVGEISSTDGKIWTTPAATQFVNGPKAHDLYNPCTGVQYANIAALDINSVPITEIDKDGQVITAYIFGDNYFELYVNGTLVAVDPVPFTPFNSCVVRFKASAPITYAVKLVDWEENPGLGTELNRDNPDHAGDGGFVAWFSDGTVTNADWKAQAYYIAPLTDPNLVVELPDGTHDSSAASTEPDCAGNCYALHYKVPSNWTDQDYDDSSWPNATAYTNDTVGVNNKPSYTHFSDQFIGAGARFIWSSNLVLDNEVLIRYTTPSP